MRNTVPRGCPELSLDGRDDPSGGGCLLLFSVQIFVVLIVLYYLHDVPSWWDWPLTKLTNQHPQPREACFQRQRDLLLPSASTTAHPALTDFGVCHDTRARLCDVPHRLL